MEQAQYERLVCELGEFALEEPKKILDIALDALRKNPLLCGNWIVAEWDKTLRVGITIIELEPDEKFAKFYVSHVDVDD